MAETYVVFPDADTPVQSLEAEQGALGSSLIDKDIAEKVLLVLNPTDFYSDIHARIFEAMGSVSAADYPVDLTTVSEWLRRSGGMEAIGGAVYLTTLMDSVPLADNGVWYARIVENYSLRRQARKLSSLLDAAAMKGGEAFRVTLAQVQDQLFSIQVAMEPREKRERFETVAAGFVSDVLTRSDEVEFQGVSTGFAGLNGKTSGFRPAELWLVVARPSVGKSAFALSIVPQIAREHRVLYLSLEMTSEQLVPRLFSLLSGVPSWVLQHKVLSDDQQERIIQAREEFDRLKFTVEDPSSMTLPELRQRVKEAEQEEVDLVIVDYASYLTVPNARDNTQAMTAITKGVKKIAKDFCIPIMLLAQLNRENTKREDKRPRMEDIRDSGAAEADADVIIGLHRDGYYDVESNSQEEDAELIVLKSRNGRRGIVKAIYVPGQTLFYESLSGDPYGRDGYAR